DDSAGSGSPTSTMTVTSSSTATPTATSTATPTLTPSPTATPSSTAAHSVALTAGINLLTFEGPTQAVAAATASLGSNLVAVYIWDASTQSWQSYILGGPGYVQRLQSLNAGQAYY